MSEHPMNHGGLSVTRRLNAPRESVYEAWTQLEHRKHWFAGPAWTEIERRVDLKVGGTEIAHGRFENGIDNLYTARFHHIEPNVRLIYAFDMRVGGNPSPCRWRASSFGKSLAAQRSPIPNRVSSWTGSMTPTPG